MTTKTQHRENARVIRAAIGIIERDGWTTGEMGTGRNPHCVMGAFRLACGSRAHTEEGVFRRCLPAQAFAQCIVDAGLITLNFDEIVYNIVTVWNDRYARDSQQVVEAMEECAASEEAKGTIARRAS